MLYLFTMQYHIRFCSATCLLFCLKIINCFVLSGLIDEDSLDENLLDEDLLDKHSLANFLDKDSNLLDKGPTEKAV